MQGRMQDFIGLYIQGPIYYERERERERVYIAYSKKYIFGKFLGKYVVSLRKNY